MNTSIICRRLIATSAGNALPSHQTQISMRGTWPEMAALAAGAFNDEFFGDLDDLYPGETVCHACAERWASRLAGQRRGCDCRSESLGGGARWA